MKRVVWIAAFLAGLIAVVLPAVSCAARGPSPDDPAAAETESAARTPLLGDANADGVVNAADAREALRCAVGLAPLTGEAFCSADTNGDGAVLAEDARAILRMSVGLEAAALMEQADFSAYPEPIVGLDEPFAYPDLLRALETLRACFPARFSYRSLGVTADGRDIVCAVVGTGRGARQIAAEAGIHGSEHRNPAAVVSVLENILRAYDEPVYNGKTPRELLADTDLYVIPMLNPDGIAISMDGLEGLESVALRENVLGIYERQLLEGATELTQGEYLRVWKANANGVDLNRNFLFENTGMEYLTGVDAPANEEYAGDRGAPEAETAAYRALIEALSAPAAVLSIHSQGGLIYWACGQSGEAGEEALRLAQAVSAVTGCWVDDEESFVGASADWTMLELGIPSVTIETGTGHNPLPLSQQAEIAEALRDVFYAAAELYTPGAADGADAPEAPEVPESPEAPETTAAPEI